MGSVKHLRHGGGTVRIIAVTAVFLFLLSSLSPLMGDQSAAETYKGTDSWTCVITLNNSDGTIETTYTKNEIEIDPTAVNGTATSGKDGSWGYDKNTGYGPFNSFYAAFDSSGNMVCHLNPYDLGKSIIGEDITGGGYDIMWVLPKLYVTTSNSGAHIDSDDSKEYTTGTMTLSSSGNESDVHLAFKSGDTVYSYLAIGVYEATAGSTSTTLGSRSGQSPLTSKSLADFRTYANNNMSSFSDGDVKESKLWNYHQYQLYRVLSLAVMESFNSQSAVGNGAIYGSNVSTTGLLNSSGPYSGSKTSTDPVKLFIENAWGSVTEYVDDAWWSEGLYAGTNAYSEITSDTSKKSKTSVTSGLSKHGAYPYSTNLDSWGLPTEESDNDGTKAPDTFKSNSSGVLTVGGNASDNADAGISYMSFGNGDGSNLFGSRLVYFLEADAKAGVSKLTLDVSRVGTSVVMKKGSDEQEISSTAQVIVASGATISIAADGTITLSDGTTVSVSGTDTGLHWKNNGTLKYGSLTLSEDMTLSAHKAFKVDFGNFITWVESGTKMTFAGNKALIDTWYTYTDESEVKHANTYAAGTKSNSRFVGLTDSEGNLMANVEGTKEVTITGPAVYKYKFNVSKTLTVSPGSSASLTSLDESGSTVGILDNKSYKYTVDDSTVISQGKDNHKGSLTFNAVITKDDTIRAYGMNMNVTYYRAVEVTVTAIGLEGFGFTAWSVNGVSASSESTLTTINSDTTIAALFNEVLLKFVTEDENKGSVDRTEVWVAIGTTVSKTGSKCTIGSIEVTAAPERFYSFSGWNFSITQDSISAPMDITAKFDKLTSVEVTTSEDLIAALEDTDITAIAITRSITVDGTITVPSGNKLVISNTGGLEVNNTLSIVAGGELENKGSLTQGNNGKISNAGTFTNSGSLTISNLFENTGTSTNEGTINNSGKIENIGTIANKSNGTITNAGTSAEITNTGLGSTITNAGALENKEGATVSNKESATIENTGTLTSSGTDTKIDNSSEITNSGKLENKGGSSVSNTGTITNAGTSAEITNTGSGSTITNAGALENKEGATVSNKESATIENTGTLTSSGTDTKIDNSSEITNSGKLENKGGSSVSNTGTITNTGSSAEITNTGTGSKIMNNGNVENKDGAAISNKESATLVNSNTGTLTSSGAGSRIDNYSTMENAGKLVNKSKSSMTNQENAKISNIGTSAVIINTDSGTMMTNNGEMANTNGATFTNKNSATFVNNGIFTSSGASSKIDNSSEITNSGKMENKDGSSVSNTGTITNTGSSAEIINTGTGSTITNAGDLKNEDGATISNKESATVKNSGTLTSSGSESKLDNYAKIENTGKLVNEAGSSTTNQEGGKITNTGSSAEIVNTGSGTTMTNNGEIANTNGSTLTNKDSAEFINGPTGVITTDATSSIDTSTGTMTNKGSMTTQGALSGEIQHDGGTENGTPTSAYTISIVPLSGGSIAFSNNSITGMFALPAGTQLTLSDTALSFPYNSITLTVTPSPSEYCEFLGWFSDRDCTAPFDGLTVSEGMTLYAAFKEGGYCTITFNSNGGSSVVPITVSTGSTVARPDNPARSGYTFSGWYTDAGCTTAFNGWGSALTTDLVLYAKWVENAPTPSEPDKYTVIFNANGGKVEKMSVSVEVGESLTLPEATKDGYTFKGWYRTGELIGVAGDAYVPTITTTLKAQYEAIKSIDVSTSEELIKALESKDVTEVTIKGTISLPKDITIGKGVTMIIESGATLTVPEGKKIAISDGATLIIDEGGTLRLDGSVVNNGKLTHIGNLDGKGIVSGTGVKERIATTEEQITDAILDGYTSIIVPTSLTIDEPIVLPSGTTMTISTGYTLSESVDAGATVVTIASTGSLTVSYGAVLIIEAGATLEVIGGLVIDGTLQNDGTIHYPVTPSPVEPVDPTESEGDSSTDKSLIAVVICAIIVIGGIAVYSARRTK